MVKRNVKWFTKAKKTHTGWQKEQSPEVRRARLLKSHKGDYLASARSIQAVANVTKDSATRSKARADAKYLFRMHKRGRGI